MMHQQNSGDVERLRASADLVGRTLAEVARHIQPGVTTGHLDSVAETFIRDHQAEPAFKGYRVGRLVFPATLCISVNEEIVHGIPGDSTLLEGDLVSVDCGVKLEGYYGDSAFTFGVGEVAAEQARLCRVTYEALMKAVEQAVVGRRVGDISHAVQAHCEAYGFGVVRDLVGHGIGRSLHEDPQVPNFGRQGTGRKLKEGLCICIEPMINQGTHEVVTGGDGWTIRTGDGKPSAHYEHMVVVRRGEAEVLSTFAYIEEVVTPPYKIADATYGEEVTHG